MDIQIILEPVWIGRNGVCELTVRCGEEVLAVDRLNITKAADRKRFVSDLLEERPELDSDKLEKLLRKLAAERLKTAEGAEGEKQSISDLLIELAAEAEFFRDENQTAYATIPVDSHFETWAIKSKNFRLWLRKRLHEEHGKTAYPEALQIAIESIESKALFDSNICKAHVRLAELDGAIFLDLADLNWRLVRIDTDGWQVLDGKPPVRFIRPRGMLPLPEPQRGGNVWDLLQFLNVKENGDFVLLLSWLVACLRPQGPYPVLTVYGEQGSAKSTACKILRKLIDPNTTPLRSEPRSVQDLTISAGNSWIVGFDNLSHLSSWLSDGLCRLSTGGGFATRELFSDRDEILFDATRPVIVNGIADVATRPDLLDRSINVTLQPIPETNRKSEADLWTDFDKVKPLILGALLDAVSTGLRKLPTTRLEFLPRMADFALWVSACEPGLQLPEGAFLGAYQQNRTQANQTALESNIIGPLVIQFMEPIAYWRGTAGEFLTALEGLANETTKKRHGWPQSARALSNQLRRIAPNLRAVGIEYKHGEHTEAGNLIILKWFSDNDCVECSERSGRSDSLDFPEEAEHAEQDEHSEPAL